MEEIDRQSHLLHQQGSEKCNALGGTAYQLNSALPCSPAPPLLHFTVKSGLLGATPCISPPRETFAITRHSQLKKKNSWLVLWISDLLALSVIHTHNLTKASLLYGGFTVHWIDTQTDRHLPQTGCRWLLGLFDALPSPPLGPVGDNVPSGRRQGCEDGVGFACFGRSHSQQEYFGLLLYNMCDNVWLGGVGVVLLCF